MDPLRVLCTLCLLAAGIFFPSVRSGASVLDHLPLVFEPNQGQAPAQTKFLCRGQGYATSLSSSRVVWALGKETLSMEIEGAGTALPGRGMDLLPGRSNYFFGSKPENWRTDISQYSKVQFDGVYPGIDLAFHGDQRRLEYDFVLQPGVDPKTIQLHFPQAHLSLQADGSLEVRGRHGSMVFKAPVTYQPSAAGRISVKSAYVLVPGDRVNFEVGAYDRAQALVIDPTLVFSTYFGGSGDEWANSVVTDASGNIFVAGYTNSANFPTSTPYQAAGAGGDDAFVFKLNPSATTLLFSTYLGGNGDDHAYRVRLDGSGNILLSGWTKSSNFPTQSAFQSTNHAFATGGTNCFITKMNPTASALVYSTYLGGSFNNPNFGLDVDGSGNAYVCGHTDTTDFPTTAGSFQSVKPSAASISTCYVAKVSAAGSLIYSTYLGGNSVDNCYDMAVDSAGNAYITGGTSSTTFPTVGAIQASNGGGAFDVFLTKMNAAGNGLVYSTYLGGSGSDTAGGIAVDVSGAAYVVGTTSWNFPVVSANQGFYSGGTSDAFLFKANPAGNALVFSTYLGGSGADSASAVALDGSGNVYVGGATISGNFPLLSPLQTGLAGGYDTFVSAYNSSGILFFSTLLGGCANEQINGLAFGPGNLLTLAGWTSSTDFPTKSAYQASYGGGVYDAFVAQLDMSLAATPFVPATCPGSPTSTPTISPTSTATPTLTPTPTLSVTSSSTFTDSPTSTATPTNCVGCSPSDTPTITSTSTHTPTMTPSATPTNSATSSPTRTSSVTASVTATSTDTGTFTTTGTHTATPTCTPTPTYTATPSNTGTPVGIISPTGTPTITATPTSLASVTPTFSITPSATPAAPCNSQAPPLKIPANKQIGEGASFHVLIKATEQGDARVDIYHDDILVLTLWQGGLNKCGTKVLNWDCTDNAGNPVGSGVYTVVFTDASGQHFAQKCIVVR
jgi:hypothetical protein